MLPEGEEPFPVVINGDACWRYVTDEVVAEVLGRGYALVTFNRTEIVPDAYRPDRDSGLYLVFPEGDFGALAAWAGADFLCYVTPAEHLGLPTPADVRQGVIASRIAGHAADIARGLPGAREQDDAMGKARRARDWERQAELALDPEAVRASRAVREALRRDAGQDPEDACSMCGRFCSVRIAAQALRGEALE